MNDVRCTNSNVVNSGVTGPNLTKFLNNVEESVTFLIVRNSFGTPVTNECGVEQFQKFGPKIRCHGNVP